MQTAFTHRSTMDPEMSTKNRGTILPAERGNIIGDKTEGYNHRNAFEEPGSPMGGTGGTDACDRLPDPASD
jgi:hypothetical protein